MHLLPPCFCKLHPHSGLGLLWGWRGSTVWQPECITPQWWPVQPTPGLHPSPQWAEVVGTRGGCRAACSQAQPAPASLHLLKPSSDTCSVHFSSEDVQSPCRPGEGQPCSICRFHPGSPGCCLGVTSGVEETLRVSGPRVQVLDAHVTVGAGPLPGLARCGPFPISFSPVFGSSPSVCLGRALSVSSGFDLGPWGGAGSSVPTIRMSI